MLLLCEDLELSFVFKVFEEFSSLVYIPPYPHLGTGENNFTLQCKEQNFILEGQGEE